MYIPLEIFENSIFINLLNGLFKHCNKVTEAQLVAHPELPDTASIDKLLDEPLVTRVSDFGFLLTVNGEALSALRFFTAQQQQTLAVPHSCTEAHGNPS